MKLRIKGNSLRLRIAPSEMTRLLQAGRIEETIRFAADQGAQLTYVLQHNSDAGEMSVGFHSQELIVVVPSMIVERWAKSSEVGIYATIGSGAEALDLAVEKDFACLDRGEDENADTFPNPHLGAAC